MGLRLVTYAPKRLIDCMNGASGEWVIPAFVQARDLLSDVEQCSVQCSV